MNGTQLVEKLDEIATLVRRKEFERLLLIDKNKRLKKQLPEGMRGCTILFKECEEGHGRLTAANWVDHGCQQCEIERLQRQADCVVCDKCGWCRDA